MPTASILLRLSKQAGDTNLSLPGMRQETLDLCAAYGFDVHAVRVDDGVSGAVRDRPGFRAWLDDARSGAVDVLVTPVTDRLTREGVNAAAMVLDVVEGKDPETGAVVRKPVRLVTADGLDSERDAESFRWRFVIAAEVARAERERIKARNLSNQRRLRGEVGRFRGGEAPYGYAKAPREDGGCTLVPDPQESAIVREIAERALSGESLYAIAHSLQDRGVETRGAKIWRAKEAKGTLTERQRRDGPSEWRIPTLQSILTGPHVVGYVRHKGQTIRGEDGLPIRWFEPLLDDQTHAALTAVVRPPSSKRHGEDTRTPAQRGAGRRPKVTRALSGIAVTSCCGGPMYAIKPSPTKPVALYRHPHGAVGSCGRQVSINAEPLEAHVEAEFLRRFGTFAEVRPAREVEERADLTAVEREIQAIARALAEPGADLPKLTGQLTSLHARRADLAARPNSGAPRLEPTGRTIGEAWAKGSAQSRNALLALFLTGPVEIAPVGHARAVKVLDVGRVVIPWRGSDPGDHDFADLVDYGDGESCGPAA
jgi:DNA invertase Pin-like site-specific DNA recombinase